MKAVPLLRERIVVGESGFVEIVIWEVPQPVSGSRHRYKYRLALVADGACVLRYDNEAGKGDHKHVGVQETAYPFAGIKKLQTDFFEDVRQWLATKQPI
jgi:hypothetical protein